MSMGAATKILILEDDARVARLLQRYLTREGYQSETATTVSEARQLIGRSPPDLLILDLVLPDGDGLSLAREIRVERDLPIIILSGRSDTMDKILGLEIGADDYITKPFDERELLARVRSVLRRVNLQATDDDEGEIDDELFGFEGWVLDPRTHEVLDPDGETLQLTSYEFQLLHTFVTRSNRVLSRDEILEAVAGRRWNPYDRSIDVLVGKLRKKLESDTRRPSLIKTIRGAGYKFTARVSRLPRTDEHHPGAPA